MRHAFLLGVAALLGTVPALAQGDADAKAAAEVLFREGKAAFDAGDYAKACDKLAGAVSLTRGEALGGALFLAQCYEKQGKTASAWAAYTEVAGKARATSQTKRAQDAEAGAAALLPKLHYLTLDIPKATAQLAGAALQKQGNAMRPELWAVRFPVDPGPVSFELSAPGKRSITKTVDIPAKAGDTKLTFEALEDAVAPVPTASGSAGASTAAPGASGAPSASGGASGAGAASASASGGATAGPLPTGTSPDRGQPWGGPRIGGAVMAGAGILGVGLSAVLGAVAKGQYDAAVADTANCVPTSGGGFACADTGPVTRARALGDAGTGVFIGGAALAVGGALLFLLGPTPSKQTARLPGVTVSPRGAALTWGGAF